MPPVRRALAATLLLGGLPPVAARPFTDAAGRTVAIPERAPAERPFPASATRDLPTTGRLTGRGGTARIEAVPARQLDLLAALGTPADTIIPQSLERLDGVAVAVVPLPGYGRSVCAPLLS